MDGSIATADRLTQLPAEVAFDGWTFRRNRRELWRDGRCTSLQELPSRLLEALLEQPGEVVSRERLIHRLWPGGTIEFDMGLNTAVRKLRAALGDCPDAPRYIETAVRRGYRFIGRLETALRPPPELSAKRPRRPPTALLAAAAAVVLVGGTIAFVGGRPSGQSHAPDPAANDLYLQALALQPQIAPWEGAPPRERVLQLLDRAIVLDSGFADAYALRARTNLDFFIANLDVGQARLARVRRDVTTARRLAGNAALALDVEGQYIAIVEQDPARALELLQGSRDRNAVLVQAFIFNNTGNFAESNALLDGLLRAEPGNQRLLRLRMINLLAQRRWDEATELAHSLLQLSPALRGLRMSLPTQGSRQTLLPADELLAIAREAKADSGEMYPLLHQLRQLEYAGRHAEARAVLDALTIEAYPVGPATAALPGLGYAPVAELRGWNALLRNDAEAARRAADSLREFLAAHPRSQWNGWLQTLQAAHAELFSGRPDASAAFVREALLSPPRIANAHIETWRKYLAATVLAWSGAADQAVTLLEEIADGTPAAAPGQITEDPYLSTPLGNHAGFLALRARLQRQERLTQAAQTASLLPGSTPHQGDSAGGGRCTAPCQYLIWSLD